MNSLIMDTHCTTVIILPASAGAPCNEDLAGHHDAPRSRPGEGFRVSKGKNGGVSLMGLLDVNNGGVSNGY